jgi:hypothetical protein
VITGPLAPGELRVQLPLTFEEGGAHTHRRQGYRRRPSPVSARS